MKYLVNKQTKEHTLLSGDGGRYSDLYFDVVEADADGWIPWSGGECPLPDGAKCEVKTRGEGLHFFERAEHYQADWAGYIKAYRPILSETAEKEEKQLYTEPTKVELLFDRLKSAVAASESIPRIIAEIDALLPDGYCVAEREAKIAEDMSDYRDWNRGDLVRLVKTDVSDESEGFRVGDILSLYESGSSAPLCKGFYGRIRAFTASQLRFYSRPAKESV